MGHLSLRAIAISYPQRPAQTRQDLSPISDRLRAGNDIILSNCFGCVKHLYDV